MVIDMSKHDKLLEKLLSRPKDFTFSELILVLNRMGYSLSNTGKTSGSRVRFENEEGDYIRLHKPHPRNILKPYQVNDIISALNERGLL